MNRRPERKNGIDDLMAWQLFTLLSSLEPTPMNSSRSFEEVIDKKFLCNWVCVRFIVCLMIYVKNVNL